MAGYDIRDEARLAGEYLHGWRMVLGLTAQQISERAGISRDTLRKLETGNPTVGFDVVLRVARALGVADVLTGSLDPLQTDLGRARAALLNRKRAR
ncbi:MAG: helix-turn-helix transcriptional regulator [Cryobacterium sp.]|nr:helix-turn-helix transcriptional regulator [Cryobacterium sp.]MCO5295064.1 helix-turn-helix domain-containing protein [Homoserinimonas sp.]